MLFALTASESRNLSSLIGATNNVVHAHATATKNDDQATATNNDDQATATNNDVLATATNNDVHATGNSLKVKLVC